MSDPRIRVLLVERDSESACSVSAALAGVSSIELEVHAVDGVAPAVERLRLDSADVVLLDTGLEARLDESLAQLRTLLAPEACPVVVLHGQASSDELRRFLQEGAQDTLSRKLLVEDAEAHLPRVLHHAFERSRLLADLESARRLGLHLAHHDTLTDLPNRQLFRSRLRQLIAQGRRSPRTLAVLFLDLDRFKQINDTLGHALGDRILQLVARRLERCVRESDTVARRGGDEFTVILDGVARGQDAAQVADKILTSLSRPFEVEEHELFLTASVGISLFPADGGDVDELVKHADISMYRAKGRGGNNYQFFLPEMNDRALERMELENNLHIALEREQFTLYYQPQVELATGRVVGVEALVRWLHPDRGLVYPDEFIPLAEETGLIVQLGDWVLAEACRQNREWQDRGLPPMHVGVNFSARQFQSESPVERVRHILDETGLDPMYLDLELTESAVMEDHAFALETLRRLRELGVSISIDDFGTGHSSLAQLKRFPITRLKIDKAFIRTLLVDPRDAAITRAIIAMAHSLDLKSVAEGVETRAQAEFLKAPGGVASCDEVQGYFFSPPVPPAEVEGLLTRERPLSASAP